MAEKKEAIPDFSKLTIDKVNIQKTVAAFAAAKGGHISVQDLEQWRVPGGKGKAWVTPGDPTAVLYGVIIHHTFHRGLWPKRAEGDPQLPPLCQSSDGLHGFGMYGVGSEKNPEGRCAAEANGDDPICPMAQWGSAIKDGQPAKGQACGLSHTLFVMTPSSALPAVLKVPAMSLKNCEEYFTELALKGGQFPSDVITRFGLETIDDRYARIIFAKAGDLPEVTQQKLLSYAENIKASFATRALPAGRPAEAPRPMFEKVEDDIEDPDVPEAAVA